METSRIKLKRVGMHSQCRIVSILSEKRGKFSSSLEVKYMKTCTDNILLNITGKKFLNKHINLVVVSAMGTYMADDELDENIRSFLAGLSRGVILELPYYLIVEFSAQIIHFNIIGMRKNNEEVNDSPTCGGQRLIVIDSSGACHCWLYDMYGLELNRDHGWKYVTNFSINQGLRTGKRLTSLSYDTENGEVTIVSRREGLSLGGYCEAPVYIDEVSICSLIFNEQQVQLSGCMVLCTVPAIHSVHYTRRGIWVLFDDYGLQYYDYSTCRMHIFNDLSSCTSATSAITMLSAVCTDRALNGDLAGVTAHPRQLYVLIADVLYCIEFKDNYVSIRSVHSLSKLQRARRNGSGASSFESMRDILIPVEYSSGGCDLSVVCLATSDRCYIVQLPHPKRHSPYDIHAYQAPIPVKQFIVVDFPKLPGRAAGGSVPVYFVKSQHSNSISNSGGIDCWEQRSSRPLAHICIGTALYGLHIETDGGVGQTSASPVRSSLGNPFEPVKSIRISPQQVLYVVQYFKYVPLFTAKILCITY